MSVNHTHLQLALNGRKHLIAAPSGLGIDVAWHAFAVSCVVIGLK